MSSLTRSIGSKPPLVGAVASAPALSSRRMHSVKLAIFRVRWPRVPSSVPAEEAAAAEAAESSYSLADAASASACACSSMDRASSSGGRPSGQQPAALASAPRARSSLTTEVLPERNALARQLSPDLAPSRPLQHRSTLCRRSSPSLSFITMSRARASASPAWATSGLMMPWGAQRSPRSALSPPAAEAAAAAVPPCVPARAEPAEAVAAPWRNMVAEVLAMLRPLSS